MRGLAKPTVELGTLWVGVCTLKGRLICKVWSCGSQFPRRQTDLRDLQRLVSMNGELKPLWAV